MYKGAELCYNPGMQIPEDTRRPLCDMLLRYANRYPERRETAERILAFVCTTEDCFKRSHPTGHLTGSCWLIHPEGGKALLTLHRKLGKWLQPGGHADGDPDIRSVALREAHEESGIARISLITPEIWDADVHTIPANATKGEPEHLHYDIRFLMKAADADFRISDESISLGWFTAEEIKAMTPPADESVLDMARRMQEQQL